MRSGRLARVLMVLLALLMSASVAHWPTLVSPASAAGDSPAPTLPDGVALSVPSGAIVKAAESGSLPGKLQVSSSGEATYDIPLDVPAGRGGMQPALGVHYGSRAGNGMMGVGWSVSGLSGITRCNATIASDNRTSGVKFASVTSGGWDADRFCLDGEKLVAIRGAYGAAGTEYRTENESFTKIFSRDSDASGPGWFEVWTKDGHKREYWPQTASRVAATLSSYAAQGEVRLSYPMKLETDRSGNRVVYSYTNNRVEFPGSGEARATELLPDRISWSPAGSGLSYRYVKFVYGKRPDPSFRWQAGAGVAQTQLLTGLEMYGPNPAATQLLWKYVFGYENPTRWSRLKSVRKCGALGGCTLARTFKYSNNTPTFPSTVVEDGFRLGHQNGVYWTGLLNHPVPVSVADYNGDGADDLLYNHGETSDLVMRTSGVACAEATCPQARMSPLAETSEVTGTFAKAGLSFARPVDVEGDGVPELYEGYDGTDTLGNPAAFGHGYIGHWDEAEHTFVDGSSSHSFTFPSGTFADNDFADFNGDGRLDMLNLDEGDEDLPLRMHANRGSEFEPAGIDTGGGRTRFWPHLGSLIDVNGDGRAELVSQKVLSDSGDDTGHGTVFGLRDDGTAYAKDFTDSRYPQPWSDGKHRPTKDEIQYGDFNGDGLRDALVARYFPTSDAAVSDPALFIRTNTGNGFGPLELFTKIPTWVTDENIKADNGLRIADMDGDGHDDVVIFHGFWQEAPTGSWRGGDTDFHGATILFAKGGFQDVPGPSNAYNTWGFSQIGDFNGDGRPDFVSMSGYPAEDWDEPLTLSLFENLKDPASAGQGTDLLIEVSDSPANPGNAARWPRERVTYSANWSDQNHTYTERAEVFPKVRVRAQGMMVVRKVESWDSVADPADAAEIASRAHVTEYAFENPVKDVQGRGFLGFDRMRVWDQNRQTETVTTFDNTTYRAGPSGREHWYPFAGLPKKVRVAVPVQALPMKQSGDVANIRVSETQYLYDEVTLNDETTHYTQPRDADLSTDGSGALSYTTHTQEWEEAGKYDADLSAADNPRPRTHLYGLRPFSAGDHFRRTFTAETRDEYANLTLSAAQVYGSDESIDGGMSRTVTTYDHSAARIDAWQLSVPTRSTVTKSERATAPAGELTSVMTRDFEYDDEARLIKEWVEKDSPNPDLRTTTTTTYGDGGEVTSVLQEADTPGTPDRKTIYDYTPPAGGANEHIYPTQVWSPHSVPEHAPSTWTVWHPGYGLPVKTVDRNAVTSTTRYDDLGRVVAQTPSGESTINTAYEPRTDRFGGINGTVVTVTRGSEQTKTYTDNAGRTIQTKSSSLDGVLVATDMKYDLLGRTVAVSRPYKLSGGPYTRLWTTTTYDSLDRTRSVTHPDGTVSTNEYPTVFRVDHYDEERNQSYALTDLTGRTVTSGTISDSGAAVTVSFSHGPHGVLEVKDPKNTTTSTYDARGRLIESVDANIGTTQRKYNGFGDIRETDNAGTRQVVSFDDLGRVTDIADFDGTTLAGHATTEWDRHTHGIGKPSTRTSRDGILTSYRYDANGRPAGTDVYDSASATGAACITDHSCSTDLTYTSAGRPETVSYPAVPGRSDRYTVKYLYTAGTLREVQDNQGTGGGYRPLWQTTETNADGNITYGRYGRLDNGIIAGRVYDPLTGRLQRTTNTNTAGTRLTEAAYEYLNNGQVKRINDTVSLRDERYTYDKLSRLRDWKLHLTAGRDERATHYDYDTSGNLTTVEVNGSVTATNTYDNPAHPNAVTSHTADGTTTNYSYDTQGRQTSRGQGTLGYHGLSLTPSTITQGSTKWDLDYDAEGNRYKKSAGSTSTTYHGTLFENRVTPSGTSYVFHVAGPPGNIAQITYNGPNTTTQYTLTDPQGTTSTVTNSDGTSTQHQYFDPFGRRTNRNGTTTPAPTTPTGITRGYTGHEMDDEYGLINMKGRLYDPATKRFTSPDPHITNPNNPQNWNPYSYVNNNPPNLTDPTGYDGCECSGYDSEEGGFSGTFSAATFDGTEGGYSGTFTTAQPAVELAAVSDGTTYTEPTTRKEFPKQLAEKCKAGCHNRDDTSGVTPEGKSFIGAVAYTALMGALGPLTAENDRDPALLSVIPGFWLPSGPTPGAARSSARLQLPKDGHPMAVELLPGGEASVLNGHGDVYPDLMANVAEGSSLTALRPGVALRMDYAHLMQQGNWDEIGRLYHADADAGELAFADGVVYQVSARATFEGAQTYLAGHPGVPYHVIYPPTGLTMYRGAGSVAHPTAVEEFLTPGSGNTVLSACTIIADVCP